ncbi:kinase-like domain-containing protein [Glomus cerebriforme]|uniref:Kinase-like domain-containing protein n=1 Tax=Glomus cerebriforme TaxID=658196 RepID=A0A397S8F6_9GLOM|nr:kinase-like domain-containing protein [Glomus cerebriforme]
MDISSTLFKIHNSGLLHENLHINNILRDMDNKIYLSDLGLTHPPNKSNPKNDIKVPGWSNSYNLLNFIPPEVINGNNYTKESDIYCFGIILWEIFSQREFFDSNQKRKPSVIINKPRLFKNNPKYPRLPYKLELLISKCWDHDPKCRPTIKTIYKQLSEWWMGSWNKNINDIITPFLNSDQIIVINVKEFDPIYIHNILRPDDDDDDDSVQSTSKHFKSILFEQPNQQNQEIIKPTKKLSLLLSQSPSSDNNIISNLLNNSTKPEETYQSSFTDKITHTNITNTNPDTKTNTNTNTPEETYETPFMDCITNIGIDDDSQLIDYDSLLNLYEDIELECAPNQSTSNNKKDELFIMPGTLPKTEFYYFKENILSNSDITFYNTYFKVGYNLFYENKMKTVLGI